MKIILGFLSVASLATGCAQIGSSQVDQSQIYTGYSATYNETGAKLELSATFSVGNGIGTSVNLDSPSEVTADSQTLDKTTDLVNQIIYQSVASGVSSTTWQNQHVFVYTDNNGTSYSNTLTIPSAVSVTNSSGSSYSKAAGVTVHWTAAHSVQSSETLVAYISGSTTGQATGMTSSTGTVGSIQISAADLAQMPTGSAHLFICRGNGGSVSQAPKVGGSYRVSYCSASVPVTLNP